MIEIDLLNLSDYKNNLNSKEIGLLNRVTSFVDNEYLKSIKEAEKKEKFLDSWVESIRKMELLSAIVNDELSPLAYGLVMKELERGGATLRSFVSVHGALVMSAVKEFGSSDQKKRYLNKLSSLEWIGCFCLTEPNFGSNPAGMETKAVEVEGGFEITGPKKWITNGMSANLALVFANLDGKIKGFLVETDSKGLKRKLIEDKWNFHSSDTAEFEFEKVFVPKENLLEKAQSLGTALKILNFARFGIAFGVIGSTEEALKETINYLNNRLQFNEKPLTTHQIIQNKLAWAGTELANMNLLAIRLSELKASGKLKPHHISMAKMNNCRKGLDIMRTCRDLLGANGTTHDYSIARRMADMETVITYEGTEHIHSLVVGDKLTGVKGYI